MNNKDLILKLNDLKKVTPDAAWLADNRELLLSQISNSGAEKLSFWKVMEINLGSAFKTAVQPAYALAAFVFVLLLGTVVSAEFFAGSKPNDSLYIARIISEQVKLTATFNAEDRDRLASQFAVGHAQDISDVLADPEFNNEDNKDKVAALSDSFNKEVDTMKNKISKFSVAKKVESDNELLTIADSSKDQAGIQLLEGADVDAPVVSAPAATASLRSDATVPTNTAAVLNLSGAVEASSTPQSGDENDSSVEAIKILEEAKQLFDAKDYNKASDKLKEVNEIIK